VVIKFKWLISFFSVVRASHGGKGKRSLKGFKGVKPKATKVGVVEEFVSDRPDVEVSRGKDDLRETKKGKDFAVQMYQMCLNLIQVSSFVETNHNSSPSHFGCLSLCKP
jgi:hypothetical protein